MKRTAISIMLAVILCAGFSMQVSAANNPSDVEIIRIISAKLDNIKVVRSSGQVISTQSGPPTAAVTLPGEELAAYTDRVFELVNSEREKAGVPPLERNDTLAEAANIRALECASVNSLYVNGQAHTRPDGTRWFTVLGIENNYNYGENTGQGKPSPDTQMESWMKSEGHQKNILREDYTEIGVGYAVSGQGVFFAVQIFYQP